MVIAGQAPVQAKGTVESYQDTLPGSFRFAPINTSGKKQEVAAKFNRTKNEMGGYYYDRKGRMNEIVFTSTPLKIEEKATD